MSWNPRGTWRGWWLALMLAASGIGQVAADTNYIRWHEKNLVDASVESWTLPELLEQIANASGWEIMVEPGASHVASSKFQNLKASEALRRLLGDLNFALLPRTNVPSRLYIFHTSLQEATMVIKPKEGKPEAKRIPNELIVTLKKG
ncbi:MAG TPA: hypothetical protein VHH73_19645, partial [Verrucomicrobiae bacterium]|nr:hypothetical protein [Verrucomicrobiae bacterium]